MFRLHVSGLPADPVFPTNLKELGYFINEDDEIRSIKNPLQYFNYFLNKNDRINTVQREAFNACIRQEVVGRLHAQDLQTTLLPLNTPQSQPHIPILTSSNISTAKRLVILFYEHTQDLGILAHRTLGGTGGINKGSCVNLVKAIQALPDLPAILIANTGQLMFNRRHHRAMTLTSWLALPRKSAVGQPPRFDPKKNTVEHNRNTKEHISYIMDVVVPTLCNADVRIDIIAVSDSATEIVTYLNQNIDNNEQKLESLALSAPFHSLLDITNPKFATWLEKRARAYIVSNEPTNTRLSGSTGSKTIQAFGCPVYSIGEPYYPELMLVNNHQTILDQFQIVHAAIAENGDYENDAVHIIEDESDNECVETDRNEGEEWHEKAEDEDISGVLGGEHAQAIEYMKERQKRLETIRKLAPNIGV